MQTDFEIENKYFKQHQNELIKQYYGKSLIIHGASLAGAYDSDAEAYFAAKRKFDPGTFIIQECVPDSEAFPVTISTLGVIADA
ncbi:MAG: hypothetical protein LBL67_01915 [Coriobacteriales bacterium]|jgi:hypothetical protein|nr:hypothetical protein [Coriobacteriales bacterium]